MKNLWLYSGVVLTCLLTISCSDNDEVMRPSNNDRGILGVVMPGSNLQDADNIFLLKDGRAINPVSGVSDFNNFKAGSKFLLTFSEVSTRNGVTDVNVSKIVNARDSVFTPHIPDTVDVQSLFAGTFAGTYLRVRADSTANDIGGTTQLTFGNSNYTCTASPNGYPLGGSGTFLVNQHGVTFNDSNTWPAGTDLDLVLKGEFNYSAHGKYLSLWVERNGYFHFYSLSK